jgi:hypothetical protein
MADSITKIKSNNRKKRYTFPNELDKRIGNNVKHKRRNSISNWMEDEIDIYNEKHVIIKKTTDGVKKEIIIKKYTKVHPVIEDKITENDSDKTEEDETNDNKLLDILSKIIVKILCYIGIVFCIAL